MTALHLAEWLAEAKNLNSGLFERLLPRVPTQKRVLHPRRIDAGLTLVDVASELYTRRDLDYEDGSTFVGEAILGTPFGQGRFEKSNGQVFEGYFHEGCLDGIAHFDDGQGQVEQRLYARGHQRAAYRRITADNRLEISIDLSLKSKRRLECMELPGGGILLRPVKVAGPGTDTTTAGAFLYPDLKTAIVGQFDAHNRISLGHYAILTRLRKTKDGFPRPEFEILSADRVTYEHPSSISIGHNPGQDDFYEAHTCRVGPSSIGDGAGDGLFAQRALQSGDLVAFFNGIRKRRVIRAMPSNANSEDWSDYSISLNRDMSLDIPECMRSLEAYKATLAHKACHSFEPNAGFRPCFHPRFGLIMSIFALRGIAQGDEILVNYRYTIKSAPLWYQTRWKQYLRQKKKWNFEFIEHFGFTAHDVEETLDSISARFQSQVRIAADAIGYQTRSTVISTNL